MIPEQITKMIFMGNSSTTHFPFSFSYDEPSDVHVAIHDIETGVETELHKNYFLDTQRNEIIYPGYPPDSAPPLSEQPPLLTGKQKLIIYRSTKKSQETNFENRHPLDIIGKSVDKLTMIAQEHEEILQRAVMVNRASKTLPEELINEIKLANTQSVQAAAEADNSARLTKSDVAKNVQIKSDIDQLKNDIQEKCDAFNQANETAKRELLEQQQKNIEAINELTEQTTVAISSDKSNALKLIAAKTEQANNSINTTKQESIIAVSQEKKTSLDEIENKKSDTISRISGAISDLDEKIFSANNTGNQIKSSINQLTGEKLQQLESKHSEISGDITQQKNTALNEIKRATPQNTVTLADVDREIQSKLSTGQYINQQYVDNKIGVINNKIGVINNKIDGFDQQYATKTELQQKIFGITRVANADNADNAATAVVATEADHATTADNAVKANQAVNDSEGNNIAQSLKELKSNPSVTIEMRMY